MAATIEVEQVLNQEQTPQDANWEKANEIADVIKQLGMVRRELSSEHPRGAYQVDHATELLTERLADLGGISLLEPNEDLQLSGLRAL